MISMVFEGFPQGGSKMLVMLAMADFARDDGTHIWPSVPSLAAKVRLQDRQVRIVLRQLVRDGFLKVEKQGKGGTQLGTTHYSICTDKLDPKHSTPARQCTPTSASECAPQTPALECTPALQSADPCTAVRKPLRASAPNPLLTVKNHHHQSGDDDDAARSDPNGAPPPSTPAEPASQEARMLTTAQQALRSARDGRAAACLKLFDDYGISAMSVRREFSESHLCTPALVRSVKRQNPSARPGGLVDALRIALKHAETQEQQQQAQRAAASPDHPLTPPPHPQTARTQQRLADDRRAADEARLHRASLMLAMDHLALHEPDRLAEAKEAVLAANPAMRQALQMYEPRESRGLAELIAAHLEIDITRWRSEAEKQLTTETQTAQSAHSTPMASLRATEAVGEVTA